MKGLISSIQRYSLRDGPGIRSTVFLMGCNLKCLWCSNPELISSHPKVMVFPNKCTGCGACIALDQDHALTLHGTTLTFDPTKDLAPFIAVCPYQVFVSVGEMIEATALVQTLLRDRLFYQNSMGGVTFSGGEPMLQPAFVKETARLLKAEGIDVAIDTAGNVEYSVFQDLNPYVDLYLYDLKFFDPKGHERYTGFSNTLIMDNLQRLVDDGKTIILRMVIVPGINDSHEEFLTRIATLARFSGHIARIDLLGYHRLGVGKYRALGEPYLLDQIPSLDHEKIEAFMEALTQLGFEVHLEQAT